MPRRNRTVRMDDAEWAALRRLPGATVADKIRHAVQSVTVTGGLGGELRLAARAGSTDVLQSLAESERAIIEQITALAGGDLLQTLAQAVAVAIADGLAPGSPDPERRRRLATAARELARASGMRVGGGGGAKAAPAPPAPPPSQSRQRQRTTPHNRRSARCAARGSSSD